MKLQRGMELVLQTFFGRKLDFYVCDEERGWLGQNDGVVVVVVEL